MNRNESRSAVFDCMIYVQGAARIKNPANACFELLEIGAVELYLSQETLAEIEDVLTRPKFRKRFITLSDEMIEAFLNDIKSKAVILKNVPSFFKYSRDPKDEKYINLAVEAEAIFVVSRDNDLLDLMTDYTDEAKDFRRRYRKIKIVNPVEFLQIIEGDLSEKP